LSLKSFMIYTGNVRCLFNCVNGVGQILRKHEECPLWLMLINAKFRFSTSYYQEMENA